MTAGGEHATAGVEPAAPGASALWSAVDDLIARATVGGVLAHRLGPLAAARMRRVGVPLPNDLRAEERAAVLGMRTGVALIERIRDLCDGPVLLLKGPEVACLYPGQARRFGDIDILTDDASRMDGILRQHGFVETSDPAMGDSHHHLHPLRLPAIPLTVEVHSSPSWLSSMRPPPLGEIFEAAVPSALGIEGVTAPSPLHHTLILVSHAWKSEPLRTLRDLVDIAALAASVDRAELDRTAAAWGIRRVCRTTSRAIDRMFYGGSRSFPLRTWARQLEDVRERSLFEDHLRRWLSPYWELAPHVAWRRNIKLLGEEIAPADGEGWPQKLRRTTRALRSPRAPVTRRDQAARGPEGVKHGAHGQPDGERRPTTPTTKASEGND